MSRSVAANPYSVHPGVTGRLLDTGGFAKKDRITHRIPIASLAEIDAEVHRWLTVAYEMDVTP
ncbi:MAG TPA: hypothetical protein VKK31_20690 [Thermoanaerobaculia bacterium]|nr:hypothetical protein [Thermoanaerobaculia bacterium]